MECGPYREEAPRRPCEIVRALWPIEGQQALQQRIESGKVLGPRLVFSGARIDASGPNRGSGPMWPESRDPIRDVPEMPVPMLLISGARDLNTPVALLRKCFDAVEASKGKRLELFENSGHAPFLTKAERFVDVVRDLQQSFRGGAAGGG